MRATEATSTKPGASSTRGFVDLHRSDEFPFRIACRHGLSFDLAKLLIDHGVATGSPIDLHACDDWAFLHANGREGGKIRAHLLALFLTKPVPLSDALLRSVNYPATARRALVGAVALELRGVVDWLLSQDPPGAILPPCIDGALLHNTWFPGPVFHSPTALYAAQRVVAWAGVPVHATRVCQECFYSGNLRVLHWLVRFHRVVEAFWMPPTVYPSEVLPSRIMAFLFGKFHPYRPRAAHVPVAALKAQHAWSSFFVAFDTSRARLRVCRQRFFQT